MDAKGYIVMDQTTQKIICQMAEKYVWWKTPQETLEDKRHFLAQIMTFATFEDCFRLFKYYGEEAFIDAIVNPSVGVFNEKSWHFWHYRLNLVNDGKDIPPLPKRDLSHA